MPIFHSPEGLKKDNYLAPVCKIIPKEHRASSTQRVRTAFGRLLLLCVWGTSRIAAGAGGHMNTELSTISPKRLRDSRGRLGRVEIRAAFFGAFFSSA